MPKSEFCGHGDQLLKTVHSLYKNGQMVDVTLHCCGKVYKVHRVVLAANSSRFFRRFFETQNGVDHVDLVLDNVCSNNVYLSLLIDFMYTGLLDITTVTPDFSELINIAQALEIDKALEFLQDKVTPENKNSTNESREHSYAKVSNLPKGVVEQEPDKSEFDQEKEDRAADDQIEADSDTYSDDKEDADDEKNVLTEREAIQEGNKIPCDICGKKMLVKSMLRHKESVHDISARKFTCSMCQETFGKRTLLTTHEIKVHSAYFCKCCEKFFSTMKELKEHKANHLRCTVCMKVWSSKSRLQKHEKSHSSEKICCEICAMEFMTKSGFLKHMEVHVGAKSFVCPLCFDAFFSESELKIHTANHADEKSFMCQYCPKIFTKKESFIFHEMKHTGEKPHICKFCNKGFRLKQALRDHIRIHTGERPFVCEICSKTFRTGPCLKNHQATHSTEKRYQCVKCLKRFKTSSKLRTHRKTHSDIRPYQCQYCPKMFATKTSVKIHEACHTGEKPFVCNVCGKAYARNSHLNRHSLIHTGEKHNLRVVVSLETPIDNDENNTLFA